MAAFLTLVSQRDTVNDTTVPWAVGAILGTSRPAPAPAASGGTPPLSYVDSCRADMLRACLLVASTHQAATAGAAGPVDASCSCVAAAALDTLRPHLQAVASGAAAVARGGSGLTLSARRVLDRVLQGAAGEGAQPATDSCFSGQVVHCAGQAAQQEAAGLGEQPALGRAVITYELALATTDAVG